MSVEKLKRLAREAELQVIEYPGSNGHFTVVGEAATVHWWPLSKKRTAWVEGKPSRNFVTVEQVILWAQTGSPFKESK